MFKFCTLITYYNGEISYLKKLLNNLEVSLKRNTEIEQHTIIIDDSENNINTNKLKKLINNNFQNSVINIKLVVNNRNVGVTKSRLIGMKIIKNIKPKYFQIVDQDDFFSLHLFENFIKSESDKDFYILNGRFYENGQISDKKLISSKKIKNRDFALKKNIFSGNFLKSPGLLIFNYRILENLITLYENLNKKVDGSDDAIILYYLLSRNYSYKFIDKDLFYYRIHDNNQSNFIKNDFVTRARVGVMSLYKNKYISKSTFIKINKRYNMLEEFYKKKGLNKYVALLKYPLTLFRFIYYKMR